MKKLLLSLSVFIYGAAFSQPINHLKANLFAVSSAGNNLVDGNDVVFDDAYADSVDNYDVFKFINITENFAVLRDTTILVIEGRQKTFAADTIMYKCWNLVQQQQYQFDFTPYNFSTPGLELFLHDDFRNENIPLSDTSVSSITFSVTADSASASPCRFYVVLRVAGTLSQGLMSINAYAKDNNVMIEWKTKDDKDISHYEVERSAEGKDFSRTGSHITCNNTSTTTYRWLDEKALAGVNYYRIKSISKTGEATFSPVVKAFINSKGEYTVYPNPVTGARLSIAFHNQPAGHYSIRMMTEAGQTLSTASVNHVGGNSIQSIALPAAISNGAYYAEIGAPGKSKQLKKVVVRNK